MTYTTSQIAALYDVSDRTVQKHFQSLEITGTKEGRSVTYTETQLDQIRHLLEKSRSNKGSEPQTYQDLLSDSQDILEATEVSTLATLDSYQGSIAPVTLKVSSLGDSRLAMQNLTASLNASVQNQNAVIQALASHAVASGSNLGATLGNLEVQAMLQSKQAAINALLESQGLLQKEPNQ